jgi:hypothetical protein
MNKDFLCITAIVATVCLSHKLALGEPWLPPGDMLIRSDLQLLADVGMLQVPLTTWPLSLANIDAALEGADITEGNPMVVQALQRIRNKLRDEYRVNDVGIRSSMRGSSNPRTVRTFEDTPRAKMELGGDISWMGRRFAMKAQARKVSDPTDSDYDYFRLDGSYIGASVGNWMLAFGYPERWWGPGWDGSLILSTNARPGPQASIKRRITTPFNSNWLRWIGPWSLTSFFEQLDDERVIQNAMLFGVRMTAMPVDGLEIGLSRTAQWCGTGRSCNASIFMDLLLGRDNEGVNVGVGEEPGNQLAGIDLRWASPVGDSPYAIYLQWIGEDTRQGGPQIGSWLRQLGVEFWGIVPGLNWQHRSHVEWSDTTCRDGGIGRGNKQFNCAYNHARYGTGYRYRGRSIGHGIDSDSFSSSIGSTLIDSRGNSTNFLARYMEINSDGEFNPLSSVRQEISELSVSYNRRFNRVTTSIGMAYSHLRQDVAGASTNSTFEWWAGFQTN